MKKIVSIIKESLYKDNKPSSSRIFSYALMVTIMFILLSITGVELGNAVKAWRNGEPYNVSSQIITTLGLAMAHQLTLMGIYKNAEIKNGINK